MFGGVPLPKSKLSDGSMRHRLLRRILDIATKTWVGVMVSSSLMIGNISVPCATWIVDDKPGTSGIWKRLTGWSSFLATCQVTLTFFTG